MTAFCITILVLTSGDRHKVDMATIDFDPKDRHGNPLSEIKHNPHIQDIFRLIQRNSISPQEMARIKEEYSLEEARQVKYLAGLEEGKLLIAKTMLKKGLEYGFIQEVTGVSLEALRELDGLI